ASADDRTITCALGGLPADTSVTVSVLTLAADPFPPDAVDPSGLVPNTATVTSPESNCPPDRPGGEECSSTTVLPPQPQVAIVKGSTAVQIVPGAPVPYAITVTNTGVVPA